MMVVKMARRKDKSKAVFLIQACCYIAYLLVWPSQYLDVSHRSQGTLDFT